MRPNRIREIWKNNGAVINSWCSIPTAFGAEIMANLGWDSLVIDMQHGVIDYQMMVTMLQGISTTDVMPIVRVPWNEPGIIMKALDAGAYAVICPMVNSRKEAEAFVGACRYAPVGYRSSGPVRATLYGGPDYHDKANDTIIAMGMIETKQAMENLDDILSTPGLDAIYVGPSDLSLSLGGKYGQDHTNDMMLNAYQRILDGCKKHGVKAGIHTGGAPYSLRMIKMGFDFVTVAGDIKFMVTAGQQAIDEMRGTVKGGAGSVY